MVQASQMTARDSDISGKDRTGGKFPSGQDGTKGNQLEILLPAEAAVDTGLLDMAMQAIHHTAQM